MKALQVWNDMRMSYYWQNFHFWVNYPFKYNTNIIITYNNIIIAPSYRPPFEKPNSI